MKEKLKHSKKYAYSDKDSPLISKQKVIFNKLVDERLEEMTKLDKKVNPDDLIYRCKGSTADEKFNEFDNPFSLLDKITDGKTSLADAKNGQAEFKSNLDEMKKGNKKHRSKDVSLRIQCKCGRIWTRKNSVYGHILHSE